MSRYEIIALVLGAVITALVGYAVKRAISALGKWRTNEIVFRYAVKELIEYAIADTYRMYVPLGKISSGPLKRVIHLHAEYSKLGGNGYVDGLVRELKALPKSDIPDYIATEQKESAEKK